MRASKSLAKRFHDEVFLICRVPFDSRIRMIRPHPMNIFSA
jgi:hypothetical protein